MPDKGVRGLLGRSPQIRAGCFFLLFCGFLSTRTMIRWTGTPQDALLTQGIVSNKPKRQRLSPPRMGSRSAALRKVATASQERQSRLLIALSSWSSGQEMPSEIADAAAPCPPEDAAVVALHAGRKAQSSDTPNIVVDIGANGGHPVTVSALRANARVVLSVDPDSRNIPRLEQRRASSDPSLTKYIVVHGAAGAKLETMAMRFHKNRNDFGGFTSLNPRQNDVYTQEVQVKPVDDLLDELPARGAVTLLKTDTQGYETQVLMGAARAFNENRVQALLAEFDPKLLRDRANGVKLLRTVLGYGMKCVHLAFSGRTNKEPSVPRFPQLPLSDSSVEAFYDFVVENTGWTDLFCLHPPS